MKKYYALAIALSLTSTAYAQRELTRYKEPRQSKVDKDVWNVTDNGSNYIKYDRPSEVLAAFEKEASLKLWPAEEKERQKKALPAGGWIKMTHTGRTIGAADPHVLTFVIQDTQGNEIQRYQPDSSIPRPFSMAGVTIYTSSVVVPVTQAIPIGSKLFVIDEIANIRNEYLLRPLD